MEVVLPDSGCNILTSDSTFYNYSVNHKRRRTYVIFNGVAHLSAESNLETGYTYTGTCLTTGDLIYKPEYKDFIFPFASMVSFIFVLGLVYHIIIKRLLP